MKHLFSVVCFLLFISSCSVVRTGTDLQSLTDDNPLKLLIKEDIDLLGTEVILPKGSHLIFRGGSISNGNIYFDSVIIKGNPTFRNCTYQGIICANIFDDRNYASSDDAGTLKFLLTNTIINKAKCHFHRDYKIDMNDIPGSGLVSVSDYESDADISFHGHTIYNIKPFTKPTTKPIIVLCNVKGITIRDCQFKDVEEHNTHNFNKSLGCTFIHCYGDCQSINLLNCSQENGDCILRSGVYTHNKNHPERTPSVGLTNSTLKVKTVNAGYGLALYCGDNLDIDLSAESPHRGFYCTGVSNSRINYKGDNPFETKCHILIKDAVYRSIDTSGNEILDMKGCHDLVIKASIDDIHAGECVVNFSSYGSGRKEGADFTFRREKCNHYNIDVSASICRAPKRGAYYICQCKSDSGALNEEDIYGCKVSNVTIHDIDCVSSETNPYMCYFGPFVEADITISNCHIINTDPDISPSFNYRILGSSSGKLRVTNSPVGKVLVREKTSGKFDIELDGEPTPIEPSYINDDSVHGLVRIMRRTE